MPKAISPERTHSNTGERPRPPNGDIYENDSVNTLHNSSEAVPAKDELRGLPANFDELPIELVSLTDR